MCLGRERKRDEKGERGQEGPRQGCHFQKIQKRMSGKNLKAKVTKEIWKISKKKMQKNINYF